MNTSKTTFFRFLIGVLRSFLYYQIIFNGEVIATRTVTITVKRQTEEINSEESKIEQSQEEIINEQDEKSSLPIILCGIAAIILIAVIIIWKMKR